MRSCRSRPLRCGSLASSTRQLGERTRGRARNSSAQANVSARQPALWINNSSHSRTNTSSSTTNTIGTAPRMHDALDSWFNVLDEFTAYPSAGKSVTNLSSLAARHCAQRYRLDFVGYKSSESPFFPKCPFGYSCTTHLGVNADEYHTAVYSTN